MLAVGGAALGAILLGVLVDHLGSTAALTLAAGLGLAGMLPVLAPPLARRTKARRSQDDEPRPVPQRAAPAAPSTIRSYRP